MTDQAAPLASERLRHYMTNTESPGYGGGYNPTEPTQAALVAQAPHMPCWHGRTLRDRQCCLCGPHKGCMGYNHYTKNGTVPHAPVAAEYLAEQNPHPDPQPKTSSVQETTQPKRSGEQ